MYYMYILFYSKKRQRGYLIFLCYYNTLVYKKALPCELKYLFFKSSVKGWIMNPIYGNFQCKTPKDPNLIKIYQIRGFNMVSFLDLEFLKVMVY